MPSKKSRKSVEINDTDVIAIESKPISKENKKGQSKSPSSKAKAKAKSTKDSKSSSATTSPARKKKNQEQNGEEEAMFSRITAFFGKIDDLSKSIKSTSSNNENAGQISSSKSAHSKKSFAPLEQARRENYNKYLETMKKAGITPFSFEEWQEALDK